jgi:Domain of unknown function (DUF1854)
MNVVELNLFHHPKDTLRLTVGSDRSYVAVKPVWASPLSLPNQYLSLLNSKGEEIIMIKNPRDLPPASYESVKVELSRRYLTATIVSIESAKGEFGATYWHVTTERGPRDFVTQSLQENAQWLGATHLMLIDVDGNRFEIPDIRQLDERSRKLIEETV